MKIISNTVIAGPWGTLDANKIGDVPDELGTELISLGIAKEVVTDANADEDSGLETDNSASPGTGKPSESKVTLPGRKRK